MTKAEMIQYALKSDTTVANTMWNIYQQGKNDGRADGIDECIEKLYEVTPQTVDEKLDMVFVNALRELKEQKK